LTKVLLDALADADKDNDGVIWMGELTHYLAINVPKLTNESQHPGLGAGFETPLFVVSH
jgi:hypothetical protein